MNAVSPLISGIRFASFVAWTLLALIPYLPMLAMNMSGRGRYVRAYWQRVTRMIGFKIAVRGVPLEGAGPVLYVANHASYLDIIVLGSLLRAHFVAKAEVAGWPGFGLLARLARTVFMDRSRSAAKRESDAIRTRLAEGDSLILFPEGTSNDGNRVLPFKSSMFAVAEQHINGAPVLVQPVSIAYARLDGVPMTRALRSFYAWYGDMTLTGHLPSALGLGEVGIEVIFHPPVSIADHGSRKALAQHCHDVIHRGVSQALSGRLPALT